MDAARAAHRLGWRPTGWADGGRGCSSRTGTSSSGAIAQRPETTLYEMQEALLAERGVRVSHDTIWRFLRTERQSF